MSITDLITPPSREGGVQTGGFITGMVVENGNKDFPGMVKVRFTSWTDKENISTWMPVLTSYAGKEHGRYLVPEVDDIVLVGFIGPAMESPFVMGSFYPAGAKLPDEQFDDKNLNRCFKTMGGVSVAIRDEKGKQRLEASTPKGLKIVAEDENETVTLSDKDGKNLLKLDCKNGEVSLLGEKKITFKTGQCELSMDGNSGAITVKGGQIKLEGSQTVEIKSNNMLKAEGGMATLEGKQMLTLKGNAMCEVSGGMVKIN